MRWRRSDHLTASKHTALGWLTPQELARLLDDSRFVVRDRAINQLAKLRSDAISVLIDVISANPSVRAKRNAIWALVRMDGAMVGEV